MGYIPLPRSAARLGRLSASFGHAHTALQSSRLSLTARSPYPRAPLAPQRGSTTRKARKSMFLFSRRVLLALAAVTALGMSVLPARAQPASDPAAFVNDVVQQALTLLRNKQLGDSDRKAQLATLLRANFDTPRIARFVLGRYWNGANVLLLDEPTNDLDVDTLRALEETLLEFPGCAVVVTHDRWFLDRIATHILAFEGMSQIVWFEGNYADYEADRKRRLGAEADQPHRIRYKPLTRA